jgi:hypothetical protein
MCPLLIEVVVAVPGVGSVQDFPRTAHACAGQSKYKQSASCGYESNGGWVVELWGDVDVVFENHEGSKPDPLQLAGPSHSEWTPFLLR